jgi:hypothetical protein
MLHLSDAPAHQITPGEVLNVVADVDRVDVHLKGIVMSLPPRTFETSTAVLCACAMIIDQFDHQPHPVWVSAVVVEVAMTILLGVETRMMAVNVAEADHVHLMETEILCKWDTEREVRAQGQCVKQMKISIYKFPDESQETFQTFKSFSWINWIEDL